MIFVAAVLPASFFLTQPSEELPAAADREVTTFEKEAKTTHVQLRDGSFSDHITEETTTATSRER